MKEITLFDQTTSVLSKIHHDGEMVSLTDLWKEAGSPKNKKPNDWVRQESTQQLIETIGLMLNTVSNRNGDNQVVTVKRGGNTGGGTYAHKNLALAYAKYLDPRLHVLVNELFFQRMEEEKNPDLITDRAIRTYKKHGKSDPWISNRILGKARRNEFTGVLAQHGVRGEGYKNCTNAIYAPLYGGTTAVIREKKGLAAKDNIRDNMPVEELVGTMFAEMLATKRIEQDNAQGNAQCEMACTRASKIVARAIMENKNTANKS